MDNVSTANRNTFFYLKRAIGLALLLALAATFFYSAYTKSGLQFRGFKVYANDNAFDSFQWTFLDLGINSIIASGIIARLMIGMELMLGLFLLCHIALRKFTYNAVIFILSIFIAYLLLVILKQGNTGNCGCFGNSVSMTPMQAIIKNIIMIAVTVLLKYIYPVDPYKKQENFFLAYVCVLLILAFCPPFIFNKIFISTSPVEWKKPINLDLLYKYGPSPNVDLRKGKRILAFMSLTCPHCRKAAYLLHIIHNHHPDIPIYLVLDGPEPYLKEFFDETHAADLPNLYYQHTEDFMAMSGAGVPAIFWMNNGVAEYKSVYAYYQLDPAFMERWLHK